MSNRLTRLLAVNYWNIGSTYFLFKSYIDARQEVIHPKASFRTDYENAIEGTMRNFPINMGSGFMWPAAIPLFEIVPRLAVALF